MRFEMAGAVLDHTTGELLESRHLIRRPAYQKIWGNAFDKEIGRFAQGIPGVVEGTYLMTGTGTAHMPE